MRIRKHMKTIAAASLGLALTGTAMFIAACSSVAAMESKRVATTSAPAAEGGTYQYSNAPEFDLQAAMRGGQPTPPPNILNYPSSWPKSAYTRGESAADTTGGFTRTLISPPPPPPDPSRRYSYSPESLSTQALKPAEKETEFLIIERQKAAERAQNDAVGCGGLITTVDEKQVVVPLKHTDVTASITGYISAVNVTQQFTNPYSGKIEAVYVFPLPENAAVSEFLMTIGDRKIRGIIREREQAEKIYNEARAQGYTASLLTQERPNIFTQKVANIEPGKAIDINITYYSTLTYSDGGYEFVFPMVVGPRFNPPETGGAGFQPAQQAGIGAVARGDHNASGQQTKLQYLRPNERSGHDISLALDIDAGVSIEAIESRTHKVEVTRTGESRATVRLAKSDSIPNRDFVVRWQVAGDSIKSAILAHQPDGDNGGYFTMMLVPPKDLNHVPRNPVELVFVLDRSGSMNGVPMQQAQTAISRGLSRLQPGDSFQIIDFSEEASQMGAAPVEATEQNVAKGQRYLATLDANGGTYMMKGLRAALEFPHDPKRLRFVAFCTDGYIGNEAEILGALHNKLADSRIFSFGVGSCNRYLMDSMARMGSGVATYLSLRDDASTIMDTFFDRISHAPLRDVTINWAGANVSEVYPSRVPDLFVGRPVILTGRYKGELPSTIRVTGRVGGEQRSIDVHTTRAEGPLATKALSQVWARAKLTEIADQSAWDTSNPELTQAAKRVALDYSLMSPFTAFVAVDSSQRTAGDHGTTVAVPVPVPEGVRYDTTVQEARPQEARR